MNSIKDIPPPKKPSRWSQFWSNLGKAIGDAMFGGNR